jgi:hypothetical protein
VSQIISAAFMLSFFAMEIWLIVVRLLLPILPAPPGS